MCVYMYTSICMCVSSLYIYMAIYILLSYPEPHPSLWKNKVRGGSLSLWKNRVWSDYYDVPYEEPVYSYIFLNIPIWRRLFCYLTQNATHPYEKIGSGEGRYPYEKIGFSPMCEIFPVKIQGFYTGGVLMYFITREQNRNLKIHILAPNPMFS